MLLVDLQQTQIRYPYLLDELPPNFEQVLTTHRLGLNWDGFPVYELANEEDRNKLVALGHFFEKIQDEWTQTLQHSRSEFMEVEVLNLKFIISLSGYEKYLLTGKTVRRRW